MTTTTNLNELAQQIHANAVAKGFWDEPRNTGEIFMLIVSELAEALEADRKGRRADMGMFQSRYSQRNGVRNTEMLAFIYAFENEVKDTVEDEIADVVIRILDFYFVRGYEINTDLARHSVKACLYSKITDNFGHNLMCVNALITEAFLEEKTKFCGPLLMGAINSLISLSNQMGFDLLRHIELKMKYNATREHKHGKKY